MVQIHDDILLKMQITYEVILPIFFRIELEFLTIFLEEFHENKRIQIKSFRSFNFL